MTTTPTLTRSEHVQQMLERDILSGALLPGAKLDEMELATRLKVSRTPVREALRHLAAAGLIQTRNRQPALVVRLSAHKLIEMFQVMAELEGLCAKLAARRITPAQLAELQGLQSELTTLTAPEHVDTFYEVNRRFHELIYEAAQNEFLAEQTRALRNRVGAYRRMVTHRPTRRTDTLAEHDAVLRCIACGDEEGAARAMQGHVNILGEKLLDFIALLKQ